MSGLIRIAMLSLLGCLPLAVVAAEDLSGEDMRSLDGQVQEIKSDVLNIASELGNLEERLLYPTNTQLALFVAIAEEEKFRLDSVQVEINGELATHHIYSFQELEALQKGDATRRHPEGRGPKIIFSFRRTPISSSSCSCSRADSCRG